MARRKFKEDVLQEQPIESEVTPIPATEEEVNNAQENSSAQENQPILEAPTAEDAMFTPPAQGYVPAGWVKIEDLAAAVAQATGDTTPAEIAPDIQATQNTNENEVAQATNPSEAIASQKEPLVQEEQIPAEEVQQESLKREDHLREYEEIKKSVIKDSEEKEKDIPEDENTGVSEGIEEEIPERDVKEDTADNIPGEEPFKEEEDTEESEESEEAFEDDEIEIDDEEKDFLDQVTSFVDDLQDDIVSNKKELETKQTNLNSNIEDIANSFESSSQFLRSLLSRDEDQEEDIEDLYDVPQDEDFEEPMIERKYRRYSNSFERSIPRARESYQGFLPAGSEHFAEEENLVKTYENTAAARRRAVANFRESIRAKKEDRDSSRFSNALRGNSRLENYEEKKSRSWNDNRFEEKIEEREHLSWKELLAKGYLG